MLRSMDDQRVGTAFRQVRIRRRLRQIDVALLASVSQSTVSRIERGHLASLTFDAIRRVGGALDIRVDVVPRWRAGDLDRLMNARHSQLHELVARRFRGLHAWVARPEVSFAIYSDRGVIDILALHPSTGMLLVIELKTEIADVNELVGTVDRKRRRAVQIASDLGWAVNRASAVCCWVIVAGRCRRIGGESRPTTSMLRAAFPIDGRGMRRWLLDPDQPVRALSMWSDVTRGRTTSLQGVRRVGRRSSRSVDGHDA